MMNPAEFANIARAEADFWWYRGMRRIMFRLLDPLFHTRRFERVLEAGCGTGHFAQTIERRYGTKIFAIDVGWEGIEYGKQLGVGRLAQADIAVLPFPSGTFDLVVCMDVIVHFPPGEEDRPMRELARVLTPRGIAAIRVSALDLLRSRHSEFARERQRFTRARLMKLTRRHGLRVRSCTYANALLSPVAFAKFRLIEPFLKRPPESGVQPIAPWLNRLLYAALYCESSWIGAGRRFPFGQSLILLAEKQ